MVRPRTGGSPSAVEDLLRAVGGANLCDSRAGSGNVVSDVRCSEIEAMLVGLLPQLTLLRTDAALDGELDGLSSDAGLVTTSDACDETGRAEAEAVAVVAAAVLVAIPGSSPLAAAVLVAIPGSSPLAAALVVLVVLRGHGSRLDGRTSSAVFGSYSRQGPATYTD